MAVARTEEKVKETREAILKVCNRVLLKDGYETVSMKMLAEAAGFTTGKIYSNFTGKPEILSLLGEKYIAIAKLHGEAIFASEELEENETDSLFPFLCSQLISLEAARINPGVYELFRVAYTESEIVPLIVGKIKEEVGSTAVECKTRQATVIVGCYYSALLLVKDMKDGDWKKAMTAVLNGMLGTLGLEGDEKTRFVKKLVGKKNEIHEEAFRMVVEMLNL